MTKTFKITEDETGQRLDVFLTDKLGLSRAKVQKLIESGAALVNKKPTNKHYHLKVSEVIAIKELAKPMSKIPSPPKIRFLQATSDFIIVEKPSDIVVHPDNAHPRGTTLIDQVEASYPEISELGEDPERPGIVHRLDKNVSGIMVIARSQLMFEYLKNYFKERLVHKEYTALVHGKVKGNRTITAPVSRGAKGKISTSPTGKPATTEVQILERYTNATLLKILIETGRTHQIKVHLLHIGHPIVGESLYCGKQYRGSKLNSLLTRPFLHATKLSFADISGEKIDFSSPLPVELKGVLNTLTKIQ